MKRTLLAINLAFAVTLSSALGAWQPADAKEQGMQASSTADRQAFDSPEAAAAALADAVRSGEPGRMLAVVGPKSRSWLVTSDAAADRAEGQNFLAAYDRKHGIRTKSEGQALLVVGDDDWEFPAPIVRVGSKWVFDSDAGREEILNRRVGRNELDTIQTLLAMVDAQREFAASDADGNGLRDYALRFASTPGKTDGLYWETADGAPPSPMGPLAAKAVREGYGSGVKAGKVQPYHGYLFRILTAQGPHADGGAFDYMVNGRLFGGFAIEAYPAAYGITGVKTFLVNHEGVVYEKDLGASTVALAEKIRRFDPGPGWSRIP
ncbi:MAG TPA: DUF2950 domain-containing protein [Caldimonas sp.]|jgi:hypothetical protein|nr:DUF2950 domain-containing protein [Caldimonas sp.]HEX4235883.1 DUF2950 domain-containing protein [Caldimonas sp.]